MLWTSYIGRIFVAREKCPGLSRSLVSKVSLQEKQNKKEFSDPTLDLIKQKPVECGPRICVLAKPCRKVWKEEERV